MTSAVHRACRNARRGSPSPARWSDRSTWPCGGAAMTEAADARAFFVPKSSPSSRRHSLLRVDWHVAGLNRAEHADRFLGEVAIAIDKRRCSAASGRGCRDRRGGEVSARRLAEAFAVVPAMPMPMSAIIAGGTGTPSLNFSIARWRHVLVVLDLFQTFGSGLSTLRSHGVGQPRQLARRWASRWCLSYPSGSNSRCCMKSAYAMPLTTSMMRPPVLMPQLLYSYFVPGSCRSGCCAYSATFSASECVCFKDLSLARIKPLVWPMISRTVIGCCGRAASRPWRRPAGL